jgi:hypothetical protein
VRVSRRFLNFTERQDLQLSAGVDVDWPSAGGGARTTGGAARKPHLVRCFALLLFLPHCRRVAVILFASLRHSATHAAAASLQIKKTGPVHAGAREQLGAPLPARQVDADVRLVIVLWRTNMGAL